MNSMSYAAAIMSFLIVAMMLMSELTVVQSQQQSLNHTQGEYKVIKSKNSEQFVFPSSSSNSDRKHPFIYTFDVPKVTNWILTIQNNMSYSEMQNANAKTIVKLKEPTQSDKFIEIAMFGDPSKKFWVAVNTRESGYIRVYEQDNDGWSRDEPVIVAHANNQGLTITNGKRIIIDRLSINDFTLASIAVYGKEDPDSAVNTYKGNISFNVVYGSPADSPLYYFPLAMIVGIGGLVACLLVFKKRKTSSEEQTQHQ